MRSCDGIVAAPLEAPANVEAESQPTPTPPAKKGATDLLAPAFGEMASTSASSRPKVWQRFVAGTASGVGLVVVGHPFDTVRTIVQAGTGSGDQRLGRVVARLAAEGPRGFYRGFLPPLALTGVINTILWGFTFSLVDVMQHADVGGSATSRAALAALPASVLVSCVVAPVEGVKTRQQVSPGPRRSVAAVARDILAKSGVRGFFRGQSALIARGSVGGGVYFGGNAAALEFISKRWPARDSRWAASRNAMCAGGFAGLVYWFPAMPFDSVKTRMMAAPEGPPAPRFVDCVRQLYASAGLAGFYRGFTVALARAVPANAAAFVAADATMRQLRGL